MIISQDEYFEHAINQGYFDLCIENPENGYTTFYVSQNHDYPIRAEYDHHNKCFFVEGTVPWIGY